MCVFMCVCVCVCVCVHTCLRALPTVCASESLGQRYDLSSQLLDLSDFYHDQVLSKHGMKGILRPNVLGAILSLIEQHCSQVGMPLCYLL